jgi:hypothetical protein
MPATPEKSIGSPRRRKEHKDFLIFGLRISTFSVSVVLFSRARKNVRLKWFPPAGRRFYPSTEKPAG